MFVVIFESFVLFVTLPSAVSVKRHGRLVSL